MSKHFEDGIAYLELSDFTPDGKMKGYVNRGKPCMVMVQGLFCGYCTQMKPAFSAASRELRGQVMTATIQIDGGTEEKALGQKIGLWWHKQYRGVPIVLGFRSDGSYAGVHEERDQQSLVRFAKSLS